MLAVLYTVLKTKTVTDQGSCRANGVKLLLIGVKLRASHQCAGYSQSSMCFVNQMLRQRVSLSEWRQNRNCANVTCDKQQTIEVFWILSVFSSFSSSPSVKNKKNKKNKPPPLTQRLCFFVFFQKPAPPLPGAKLTAFKCLLKHQWFAACGWPRRALIPSTAAH